jgi:hypothetical protein
MGTMPLSWVSLRKTPLRYSTAANPKMRGTVKWEKNDTTIKYRPFPIAFQYFYYLCINIIQQPALNATDSEAFKTVTRKQYQADTHVAISLRPITDTEVHPHQFPHQNKI